MDRGGHRGGVTHLGENRVQEAQAKFAPRGTQVADKIDMAHVTLHLIGTLQRNKVRQAAALFDWVQSVGRPELVETLNLAAASERDGRVLPVLLQVNLTGEATKSGVAAEDLPRLADTLATAGTCGARG